MLPPILFSYKMFSLTPNQTPYSLNHQVSLLSPQSTWQPALWILFLWIYLSYILYRWNYKICCLLCLTSCTEHSVFKFYLCGNRYRNFISFYGWITFHFVYLAYFVYPFIYLWRFGLLPPFVYCELWCFEYPHRKIFFECLFST